MTLGDRPHRQGSVLLLALGGSTGTIARYALSEWFKLREWVEHFPWHTFTINAIGSFRRLGAVVLVCQMHNSGLGWLLLLGTGFCGGFTTFSTFSVEALRLFEKDRPAAALGYVIGSVVAGVLGAWAGVRTGGRTMTLRGCTTEDSRANGRTGAGHSGDSFSPGGIFPRLPAGGRRVPGIPLWSRRCFRSGPAAKSKPIRPSNNSFPTVVMRCDGRLFHYRRGKAGTETRLTALRSVGVGGHISESDAAGEGSAYGNGMRREVAEEVVIGSRYTERGLGFIFDDSTPVGSVHLGVVHLFELESPAVTAREAALADAGFAHVAELVRDVDRFETWSQFVLRAITN